MKGKKSLGLDQLDALTYNGRGSFQIDKHTLSEYVSTFITIRHPAAPRIASVRAGEVTNRGRASVTESGYVHVWRRGKRQEQNAQKSSRYCRPVGVVWG